MSNPIVVSNAKLLFGPYDLGGDSKAITLNLSSAMLDNTSFPPSGSSGTVAISRVAGLHDASLTANGYLNLTSSGTDATIFPFLGSTDPLVTAFPNGITVGSTTVGAGYALQGGVSKFTPLSGNVGQLLPFTVDVQGATQVARVTALYDATPVANTLSSGITTGTAYQPVSTITSTQSVYGGFHVTALSTTLAATISAVIQAATSSGFSSPTSVITFGAQSCKYGTWATPVAGNTLSTNLLFWRTQITVSTGTSTGAQANGLVWYAIQQ